MRREAAPQNGAARDEIPFRRISRPAASCIGFPGRRRSPPSLYLHEADARGGALDVDEYRPRERDLVLILAALFPGHFHKPTLAHDRRINNGCICMLPLRFRLALTLCVSANDAFLLGAGERIRCWTCANVRRRYMRANSRSPSARGPRPSVPGNHVRIEASRVPGFFLFRAAGPTSRGEENLKEGRLRDTIALRRIFTIIFFSYVLLVRNYRTRMKRTSSVSTLSELSIHQHLFTNFYIAVRGWHFCFFNKGSYRRDVAVDTNPGHPAGI